MYTIQTILLNSNNTCYNVYSFPFFFYLTSDLNDNIVHAFETTQLNIVRFDDIENLFL